MGAPRAESTIEIQAPIDRVWKTILDLSAYREWNPFIVKVDGVDGAPVVGQRMRLHVVWSDGGGASSNEVFDAIEPPDAPGGQSERKARLVYSYRGPLHALWLVRATRVQTLSQAPGGPTRYHTVENFSGLLSGFIPIVKVQDGFERHARALKDRAERPAGARVD
jgi:hypothetical protein